MCPCLPIVITGCVVILGACTDKGTSKPAPRSPGLTASEPIVCQDPALRSALHYDKRQAAAQPLDGAYLAGGGLVIADFSGDGIADMFLPSEITSQLWITTPGTETTEILFDDSGTAGLTGIDLSMAVGGTAVDYDGDGDLDLFVTRWEQPNLLLANDGTGTFTDVTTAAFLAHSGKSQSSSWGDFDFDGDLDVFVGNYGNTPDTHDDPAMAAGEPSELYRNEGGGQFTDVSSMIPSAIQDGYSFMSAWYDIDGDHYPELFSAHDFGLVRDSTLAINNGGTSFTANHLDTNWHPQVEDMGMAVGDVNGDEVPDFLFSSWKTVSLMESSPSATSPLGVLWVETNQARTLEVETENRNQVYGWGADFGDVDNDADLDALITFGYWSTYDSAGDPLVQVDGLWIQDAQGNFANLAPEPQWAINDKGIGRGFVFHDLNGDGYLDVIKRELDGPTLLYLSRCGDDNWTRVRLEQPGPNTKAIGAMIRVRHGGKSQVRWIHSGSSGMYTGNPPEAHFGLGPDTLIDQLDVIWPDGQEVSYEHIPAKRILTISRP
jgi:enediyne biosynthesis protein E4